jgi:hypothetical protein
LAPLSKSSASIELEIVSWVEVALLIEMVVDWRVDGSELLQTSHPSEAEHGAFSSSKRQVEILSLIIEPAASFLFVFVANNFNCSTIGT